jgi:inorganic pyrophosphatase
VPSHDPRFHHVNDLPKRVRKELEQFFVTASEMTSKHVDVDGWDGPRSARDTIAKAAQTYVRRGL